MDSAFIIMDLSIMVKWPIYKEERFRTPLSIERAIGLWVDRIGQGVDYSPHRRLRLLGQYAAVYVDSGTGKFHSPTTGTLNVQPGQVMILFPDEPNTYFADKQWTTQWIVWNGPDAATLEQVGYLSRDHCVQSDLTGTVNRVHHRLTQIITQEDTIAVLERKKIILELVLDLFKTSRQIPHLSRNQDTMKSVVTFLSSHYRQDLPVEKLAERFNLSPPHFRRLFKDYTGRSPREFITALRISKAKELLSQGKTIKETAALTGYDDLFYFMRIFKKTTGLSPGKFTFLTA